MGGGTGVNASRAGTGTWEGRWLPCLAPSRATGRAEPEAAARDCGVGPSLAHQGLKSLACASGSLGRAIPNGYGRPRVVVRIPRLLPSQGSPNTNIVRTYEANRDLLLTVANYCSGSLISSYDYDVDGQDHAADAGGRRTKVTYGGPAFSNHSPYPARTDWGYNDRSEVTTAAAYTSGGTELTTFHRVYEYDPIGNRHSITEGTSATQYYAPDAVNAYSTLDTTSPPSPPYTESFTYDHDGNMTQDGGFNYTWDAENRLVAVTPRTPVVGSSKKCTFVYDYLNRRVQKETYGYYSNGHGGYNWFTDTRERYVYDGWNVVLTLNGLSSNAITRKCTWGLDLSGTLQGAGGIGGLLATVEGTYPHWFFYDGNGNVTEMIQPSVSGTGLQSALPCDELRQVLCDPPGQDDTGQDGGSGGGGDGGLDGAQTNSGGGGGGGCGGGSACTILAHYEYDPYGKTVYSNGTCADVNPFRFSTKWIDYEVAGLYYYGERYYSPRLGRWVSRDPIGERDTANLYNAFRNNPTDVIDPLGLGCKVFYKCNLVSSTGTRCSKHCEYICPERKGLPRVPISGSDGGTIDCENPGIPTVVTRGNDTSSFWCNDTLDCGRPAKCQQSFNLDVPYDVQKDLPGRNCSRTEWLNKCDLAKELADKVCDELPTGKEACKVAAAVAQRACRDVANTWCKNR